MSSATVERPADAVIDPDGAEANPHLALFRPYVPAGAALREFTLAPLIVGTLLGIVFGASSLYLVLKVGLTVSASIPVAVISITLFRLLSTLGLRNATILENNIVQTAGSAGESIAFGLGVTMPAIMILGFDLEVTRAILVAVLGGLLGILMMIPLRRALIVQQHGYLKYPEGTACAEVLKAGACDESRAAHEQGQEASQVRDALPSGKTIFTGFGIGFVYYAVAQIFKTWKAEPGLAFKKPFDGASIALDNNPALLGVGYIIGPRTSCIMLAGGMLSYLVLIPAIKYFGADLAAPLAPATSKLIRDMSPSDIRTFYVLYIGAGAVAAGGIISLARSLPIIWRSLQAGLADLKRGGQSQARQAPRTEQDISFRYVIGGIVVLILAVWLFSVLHMNLLGALFVVLFGFLFVTVSSRLTGEIGSSSNPISGMTVATLLMTCLAFLIVGWTAPPYYVTALSVGAIVCIAASNGGGTSQDLKTGFLVGATPKYQQLAILIGALASALVLGPILLLLNESATVTLPVAEHKDFSFPAEFRVAEEQYEQAGGQAKRVTHEGQSLFVWHKTSTQHGPAGRYLVNADGRPVYFSDPGINGIYDANGKLSKEHKYDAPKATLMSYIIKGILSRELPWGLVLLGVMIALVLELCGIPSLAFAVGVYLQIATSVPIFIGGAVRWLSDKYTAQKSAGKNLTPEQLAAEGDKSPGVLMASGYIAGGALAGVLYAFLNLHGGVRDWLARVKLGSESANPFFMDKYPDTAVKYPYSNFLALLPFLALTAVLYLVARELWLRATPTDEETAREPRSTPRKLP